MVRNIFRKSVVIGIIILFLGASVTLNVSGIIKKNDDIQSKLISDDSWKHKITISINTPTPVNDFQIKIELDNSRFDYSKTNIDGSDIRFYDEYNNKLNYWIEKWNPYQTSIIWIKIIKAGTEKIFMYYGNNKAKSESNGDDTFIFFDDFKNSDWREKWETIYNPYVSVSQGKITITDTNGDKGYLVSKSNIQIGTIIRFRFKEKKDGANPPNGQVTGLFDVNPQGNSKNYMYTGDSAWWGDWGFLSGCCNGTQNFTDIIGLPDIFNYRVNEFHWGEGVAKYYYRDNSMNDAELKASHEVVPEGDLYLQFMVTGKNTIICDWITVTKLVESGDYNVSFFDDFNDNNLDESKWTEIYNDGFFEETNKRLELTVYEDPSTAREYFESCYFEVNLSSIESICIKWDMITTIQSTALVGAVGLIVTDGVNWIKAMYMRMLDCTIYQDSNDGHTTNLNDEKDDGSWGNEIRIFKNRYCVRMDQDVTNWINDQLFESNSNLKIKIFIDSSGGDSPELFTKVAFDNIIVEVPSLNPCEPIINGPFQLKLGIPFDFKLYTTDPDGDNIIYYIEWGDNTIGEFFGPVNSGDTIIISHTWITMDNFNIRAKVIDINAYESSWIKFPVSTSKSKTYKSININEKITQYHPNMFPILQRLTFLRLGLQ